MKTYAPTDRHREIKADVDALIKKHADRGATAQELLAIASQVVGMLVALQDQRIMTPAMAMEVVGANIETGNAIVLNNLRNTPVPGGLPS